MNGATKQKVSITHLMQWAAASESRKSLYNYANRDYIYDIIIYSDVYHIETSRLKPMPNTVYKLIRQYMKEYFPNTMSMIEFNEKYIELRFNN